MQLPVMTSAEPWFKEGLRFTCTKCGNCCTGGPGYVWISTEEIERLSDHLGLPVDQTIRKYCRNVSGKFSLREKFRDGLHDCIFLEHTAVPSARGTVIRRTCSIYPVRPLQCRTWPFWDGNLMSRESWDRAGGRCPGVNQGDHYTPEQVRALRDAQDWPAEKHHD